MDELPKARRPFISRYNVFCRFISGDYKAHGVADRLAYRAALALLKISTGFIMVSIALAGIQNVPDFCDVSINIVSFLTIEVYALLFVLRSEEFNVIVNKLASLWLETRSVARTQAELCRVRICNWSVRLVVPLLNSGAFAIFIGYATAPIVIFLTSTSKNRRMGLPFKMGKFFDDTDFSAMVSVYVITVICLSYSCFLIINLNALYLSMLCILETGLNLSSLYMCRAYQNRCAYGSLKTTNEFYFTTVEFLLGHDLKRSLVQHQRWLRAASEMKQVMNERFLVLHMGTITVTTLASFLTANDPARHYYQIAMAFIPLGIYFFFFLKATNISTTAGELTAKRLYFCHMQMPKSMRMDSKDFLFIMRRLQRPVFFEIGKFWPLSLMRFFSQLSYAGSLEANKMKQKFRRKYTKILQHIFSVIMLLRSINNRPMTSSMTNTYEVT